MDRESLEGLGRDELVIEARRHGVKRPEVMTRVELVDEILRLGTPNPVERKQVRGWLGIARDLIASAVELGLNLPDAAAMIRGDVRFEPLRPEQPPVATVTLAEIYGAQGHFDRAVGILDEVLEREPDHEVARRLRARLAAERDAKVARQTAKVVEPPERPNLVSEVPEPRALEDEEPDHVTLVPAKPPAAELGEFEDDHATLVPVRPDPVQFMGDDSEHTATLVPVRPDVVQFTEDGLDHAVTRVPVRPGSESPEDEVDLPTLPPMARSAGQNGAASADEPDLPTLFPSKPEGEGALDDDWDRPTNPPLAAADDAAKSPEGGDASAEPVTSESFLMPAVVLARTGAETVQVYFELGSLTEARSEPIVLRVVEHRPRVDGVERVERDLAVIDARGTATFLDLECGSFVRAALGRKWDGQFKAAAVAAEIRLGDGPLDVAWAPRPGVDYQAVANRAGLGKMPD
jgi:hypothetical protein